jgi:hypothetical protein
MPPSITCDPDYETYSVGVEDGETTAVFTLFDLEGAPPAHLTIESFDYGVRGVFHGEHIGDCRYRVALPHTKNSSDT